MTASRRTWAPPWYRCRWAPNGGKGTHASPQRTPAHSIYSWLLLLFREILFCGSILMKSLLFLLYLHVLLLMLLLL